MNEIDLLKNEINKLNNIISNQAQKIINLQDLLSCFKRKAFGAILKK